MFWILRSKETLEFTDVSTLVTSTELSGAEDPIFLYPVVLNWSVKGAMKEGECWTPASALGCFCCVCVVCSVFSPIENMQTPDY